MKKNSLLLTIAVLLLSCNTNDTIASDNDEELPKKESKFNFVFMTDLHLNNQNNNCFDWFDKSIEKAKADKADFILTGGDNVDIDGLKDYQTADQLYGRFAKAIEKSKTPFYVTVGNHDRFWGVAKEDPLYNEGLFEKHLNKNYYSFDHKGWHFIVLNSSNSVVDDKQKLWLRSDLSKLDRKTPIIVSVHVPFLSVYYPTLEGRYTSQDTFSNFKEIWDMFENKNLKLVLQGHMHLYEEIKVKGVQFITGGSLSANWWSGPYHGTESGYLLVTLSDNDFSWEYKSIGWKKN